MLHKGVPRYLRADLEYLGERCVVRNSLIEQVENVSIHREPFPWPEWTSLIDQGSALRLVEELPRTDFVHVERAEGTKRYSMERRLLVQGTESHYADLSPAWIELIDTLRSDEYVGALSSALQLDLMDLYQEVTLWRYPPEGYLSPHPDHIDKVFSQLIYLNRTWSEDWGGCLRLLGPDGAVIVTPDLGRSVGIIRTDDSLHEVTPVINTSAPGRLSIQVIFSKPPVG